MVQKQPKTVPNGTIMPEKSRVRSRESAVGKKKLFTYYLTAVVYLEGV